MGIVNWLGDIEFFGTDRAIFQICKIQQDRVCSKCLKKLPKGSYVFGKQYQKFCLDCGLKLCGEGIEKFREFADWIEETKKEVIKNKDEYDTNNTVCNL